MRLAIMQPYFFPYLGYWQLLNAVDRFVIYDDVNFIKRGWINRNRILINGSPAYITLPLAAASQNKRICDIKLEPNEFRRQKLLKTIANTYGRASCYRLVYPTIEAIVCNANEGLAEYLLFGIKTLAELLGIKTAIIGGSRRYGNDSLKGADRIMDICARENADTYLNLEGGIALYDRDEFGRRGIRLEFLKMNVTPYRQGAGEFVPYLSIIDLLMHVGPREAARYLDDFQYV